MTFEAFDVVIVPFPFTDRLTTKRRPALVVSNNAAFDGLIGHSVLAMITSGKGLPWPLDTPILDIASAGLPTSSMVRMKLFTLDHRLVIRKAGHLANSDAKRIQASLSNLLHLS